MKFNLLQQFVHCCMFVMLKTLAKKTLIHADKISEGIFPKLMNNPLAQKFTLNFKLTQVSANRLLNNQPFVFDYLEWLKQCGTLS